MFVLQAEALLFDSDGVLIDSHHVVERAWRHLAAELDLDADRLVREQPGVRAEDTLSRYLPHGRTLEAAARLEALELELADQVELLPGSLDLTARLPAARWAIVTSGSRRLAMARWKTVGFHLPPAIVTAEDVAAGKPDPAPYLKASDLLDVDPAKCVVFEDSPSGGAAASAIGATVVAVGDLPWPIEPKIRIRDLTQVSYDPKRTRDASIAITINPSPTTG